MEIIKIYRCEVCGSVFVSKDECKSHECQHYNLSVAELSLWKSLCEKAYAYTGTKVDKKRLSDFEYNHRLYNMSKPSDFPTPFMEGEE